ncbi:M23 family metallopeptidase [Jannaschia rubra]|uniref:Murein hydrolase activator NlpD n=1 Tax=Jannaschia rubra TaxID=282197 RepID=A0A0M6XVK0_9RHOB|nr:M23 family metallopeptidase [Jannaschia rubra]CTQ34313.1 Murein hydrolase activator NlpD precursor [Jannaschia rubra]SFG18157.1 Murein DD-endopeptidase MepM and murein hydrolase activator NlpD, contain LysM domain [Jannaschia rubra]
MSNAGRRTRWTGLVTGLAVLAGCSEFESGNLDYDLRNGPGNLNTTAGVTQSPADRPRPDANGLITYPNYQVVVARRGDTVTSVAQRIGFSADELARFNGLRPGDALNADAVLALPSRVTPGGTAGGRPDISSIAGQAIDRASGTGRGAPVAVQGGQEPVRHRVARGETAFSIARLYGVSPAALAEWNGLGTDLAVREGQYLLIPLVIGTDGAQQVATPVAAEAGTPVPPSASSALPQNVEAQPLPPSPNLDQYRSDTPAPVAQPVRPAPAAASSGGALARPVSGEVLRPFSARNEGIDFRAAEGTAVQAAAAGTVAAITRDTDQVPILVLRHADGLLTVYANIKDIAVKKGDSITAGQRVASVGGGDPSFLHFEVRRGFDAVDPAPLLR